MRRAGACLLVLLAACKPWHARPCLESADPRTAALRKAWLVAENERAPWQARVCALESTPSRFGDYTDRFDEPACRPELVDELEDAIFSEDPIHYSRLQLARVRAIGRVWDITDVMDDKARVLIRLAELDDDDIGDYRLAPDEQGPPPPKRFLRELALHHLVGSNLFLNVPEARDYLLKRERTAKQSRDKLTLSWAARAHFENTLWGHPRVAIDNGSFAILARWIDDAERRLEAPYDPAGFELLLIELEAIGYYARRFRVHARAGAVLSGVVASAADRPCHGGSLARQRDLYVMAKLAQFDLASPPSTDQVRPPDIDPLITARRPYRLAHDYFGPMLYQRGVDCRGTKPSEPPQPDRSTLRALVETQPNDPRNLLLLARYGEDLGMATEAAQLLAAYEQAHGVDRTMTAARALQLAARFGSWMRPPRKN